MKDFINYLKRDVSRLVLIQLTSHHTDYALASTPVQHWPVLIWSIKMREIINQSLNTQQRYIKKVNLFDCTFDI
jgi:hypothetical protein